MSICIACTKHPRVRPHSGRWRPWWPLARSPARDHHLTNYRPGMRDPVVDPLSTTSRRDDGGVWSGGGGDGTASAGVVTPDGSAATAVVESAAVESSVVESV